MNKLIENLANLIKVKTLVTLVVITVFAVLALTGAIPADGVKDIVYIVIAFYFGTQHEKKNEASVAQPAALVIGTVPENEESGEQAGVDTARYHHTHPDSIA